MSEQLEQPIIDPLQLFNELCEKHLAGELTLDELRGHYNELVNAQAEI